MNSEHNIWNISYRRKRNRSSRTHDCKSKYTISIIFTESFTAQTYPYGLIHVNDKVNPKIGNYSASFDSKFGPLKEVGGKYLKCRMSNILILARIWNINLTQEV